VRYGNHTKFFRHKKYEKVTELSKYIWKLKAEEKVPIVKWKTLKNVNGICKNNFCRLCLTEKAYIINSLDDDKLIHKRSELVS
jgi:hypothetical protein